MIKTVLLAISIVLVIYGICAFTLWDLNPANWSQITRFACLSFGLTLGIGAAGIYKLNIDYDEKHK